MLVIGAGPAGLAVTGCLKKLGIEVDLVDRHGQVGGAYRQLYPRIELATPARWISLPGLPLQASGEYVSVEQYSEYLQAYAARFDLVPQLNEVRSVRRVGPAYEVVFGDGRVQPYQAVVTATGKDALNWPDFPREAGPIWLHSRDWQGPQIAQGGRLLVIGRGVSAVEIAEEAVRAGIDTTVSCRGRVQFGPRRILGRDVHDIVHLFTAWFPRWLALGFCGRNPTLTGYDQGFSRYQQQGLLKVVSPVRYFVDRQAVFTDGSAQEFDVVVCATGYRFALPYLPPDLARSPADGHPLGNGGQSVSHPGLYLMGVHCSRLVCSQFLRGMALDAPQVAASVARRLGDLGAVAGQRSV